MLAFQIVFTFCDYGCATVMGFTRQDKWSIFILVIALVFLPWLDFVIFVANRPVRFKQVISHRGNGFGYAENTLQAIQAAHNHGYWVEIDVRLTSDNRVVLVHDATLDRTTNCTGPVLNHSLAEIRACGVPELRNVIESTTGVLEVHCKTRESIQPTVNMVLQYPSERFLFAFKTQHHFDGLEQQLQNYSVMWIVLDGGEDEARRIRPHMNLDKDMYAVTVKELWNDASLVRYVTSASKNLSVSNGDTVWNRWMTMGMPITHVEVDNPLTFETLDASPSMPEIVYRASAVGVVLAYLTGYLVGGHARAGMRYTNVAVV